MIKIDRNIILYGSALNIANIDIKKKDLREGKLVDAAFKQTRKPKDSKEKKSTKKDSKRYKK